jgi:hypothetical protein
MVYLFGSMGLYIIGIFCVRATLGVGVPGYALGAWVRAG